MSLSLTVDGVAVLAGVPPTSIAATQIADDGNAGHGGFNIEDPGADVLTVGHKPVIIQETECSQPRLFTGWTTVRNMGRDDDGGLIVSDDRQHDVTVVDLNAAVTFRILRGADTNRPEESIDDRLAWLIGKGALTEFVTDFSLVATGYSATLDEADYRGRYPADVLNDCLNRVLVDLCYFCFWNPVTSEVGLYFGPQSAATTESTLAISNVLEDIDGSTIFPPDSEAKLARKPDQVYSGVLLRYADGSKKVFRSRQSTADAFVERSTTVDRPRTKRLTTAQSQADRFLTRHSYEEDIITVTIIVPPESAGLAVAGQRIDVRFSHLPGYTSWTSMRILSSSITPTSEVVRDYAITLELEKPYAAPTPPSPTCSFVAPVGEVPSSADVWGATYTVGGVYTPGTPGTATVSISAPSTSPLFPLETYGAPNAGGDFGIATCVFNAGGLAVVSWTLALPTPSPICRIRLPTGRAVPAGKPVWVVRLIGPGETLTYVLTAASQDITLTAPYPIVSHVQWEWSWFVPSGLHAASGETGEVLLWSGDNDDADPDADEDLGATPGSPVQSETPAPLPDGSNDTFGTDNPYQAGTLRVFIDGLQIPASEVTESSPGTGEFVLSWEPDASEQISVMYVVAG